MYRLIYSSTATEQLGPEGVEQILTHAKTRNKHDGITGIILFHKGSFLQALEGPKDKVISRFDRIKIDPRHENVQLLSEGDAKVSLFEDWKVGHAVPNQLSNDVGDRAMTLVKVTQWLEQEASLQDVEEQDVFFTIWRFLDGLGEIDARLDVDFLQCFDKDRRSVA